MAEPAEAQINKRKLDALKRGIHRMGEEMTLPCAVHVVGVGKTGNAVVAQFLRDAPGELLEGETTKITALAIDIGDKSLAEVRAAAAAIPAGRADVRTLSLEVPAREELFSSLRRYREFLKLEYPRYYWNPNYEPWVQSDVVIGAPDGAFSRAVAKAIYGRAYYDGARTLEREIDGFARSVDSAQAQSVVCVIFGVGEGVGSGIVVDLARHVSNVKFGRRLLVVGIGIMPCDGDAPEDRGAQIFPVLNELDCMGDVAKNEGVIAVWGDLYRNPFTGGMILVPQQPAYDSTGDIGQTKARVGAEVVSFLTRNKGADLWETLRLLNWVGAPPTQHSAARTQYGPRWAHVLGFVDTAERGIPSGERLRRGLGLTAGYRPEFVELRTAEASDARTAAIASDIGAIFKPVAPIEVAAERGGKPGSVQFMLPCVAKTDLASFYDARAIYDRKEWGDRLLDHSWLLDLGVMLCEPAIRFEGMAGECLWGCACWVVVPYEQIRGPQEAAPSLAVAAE